MTRTVVQIRRVPQDLHRRLKARADDRGRLHVELRAPGVPEILDRPTGQEILERLQAAPVLRLKRSAAAMLRAEREAR